MTRRTRSSCILAFVLATPLTVGALVSGSRPAPAAATPKKVVLTLSHVLGASHPVHATLQFMSTRLGDLSNGTVELTVASGADQGTEPDLVAKVQSGSIAAAKVSAGILAPFAPDMAVFGMPYLFTDDQHYWHVLLGEIGKEILASGRPRGLEALAYYDSGSRSFYTQTKPIAKPEDLRGLKLRVQPSSQAQEMVTALGGVPTPMAYNDIYAALQSGRIEGAENNPPSFYTSRHYEVAKYLSLDEHTRVPDVLIFSKKVWDGLSPQVRAWMTKAAAESVGFQRKLWRDQTEEALREVQKAGVTIHRPDQSVFAAAMGPMYTKADGTRIGELARRIMVAE